MTTQRYLYDPSDLMQVGVEFTDVSELFDEEICTHGDWPMPSPRNFSALNRETKSTQGEPAECETKAETKSWRENLRALVERVKL